MRAHYAPTESRIALLGTKRVFVTMIRNFGDVIKPGSLVVNLATPFTRSRFYGSNSLLQHPVKQDQHSAQRLCCSYTDYLIMTQDM